MSDHVPRTISQANEAVVRENKPQYNNHKNDEDDGGNVHMNEILTHRSKNKKPFRSIWNGPIPKQIIFTPLG